MMVLDCEDSSIYNWIKITDKPAKERTQKEPDKDHVAFNTFDGWHQSEDTIPDIALKISYAMRR